jgi:hypothetical protein
MATKKGPEKGKSKKLARKKRVPSPSKKAKVALPSGVAAKVAKAFNAAGYTVETIDRTSLKAQAFWHAAWRFKFKGRYKLQWVDLAVGLERIRKDVKELSRRGLLIEVAFNPDPESVKAWNKKDVWRRMLAAADIGTVALSQSADECRAHNVAYKDARILEVILYVR